MSVNDMLNQIIHEKRFYTPAQNDTAKVHCSSWNTDLHYWGVCLGERGMCVSLEQQKRMLVVLPYVAGDITQLTSVGLMYSFKYGQQCRCLFPVEFLSSTEQYCIYVHLQQYFLLCICRVDSKHWTQNPMTHRWKTLQTCLSTGDNAIFNTFH